MSLAELLVNGRDFYGIAGGEEVMARILVDCFEEMDDNGSEAFRDLEGNAIETAVFTHRLAIDL